MAAIIMSIVQIKIASPLDDIIIQATEQGVSYVGFYPAKEYPEQILKDVNNIHIHQCISQLDEYFNDTRRTFTINLDTKGTDFQKGVWQALLNVPFGQVQSYSDIARAIGNPKAVRAVGAANGKNPISIIVPCHRIIGASGKLTGYAGGLERKQWLLKHEGIYPSQG